MRISREMEIENNILKKGGDEAGGGRGVRGGTTVMGKEKADKY